MGRTEGAAYGMIDKDGARRAHCSHDIEHRADDECRDSLFFNDIRDQTDAFVAEGSVRNEERKIDL